MQAKRASLAVIKPGHIELSLEGEELSRMKNSLAFNSKVIQRDQDRFNPKFLNKYKDKTIINYKV